jgi:Flp pilus assembly protein TadD
MGNVAGARNRVEQGLKLFPRDPELLFRAGIIYHESGELDRAEHSYLKLLNDHEVGHIDSIDVSMTSWKAHNNLGVIYREMGRNADSDRHSTIAQQMQQEG